MFFQSLCGYINVQGPFEKFVDWQQYAAVNQREVVTVCQVVVVGVTQ
jgi:hypothetical protein